MFDILHIITTIERGGAENAVKILSQEQVKFGKRVAILPLRGNPELFHELAESGVYIDLSLLNLNFFFQFIKIQKLVKGCKILHCHLPRAEVLGRFALAKNSFVITRHNSESFFPGAPQRISSFLSRFVTSKASRIIAISDAVKMFMIKNHEICDTSKVFVIYYGYRRSIAPRSPRAINFEVSCINKKMRFGSLSRLSPQKNIPLMIDFAKALVHANARFSIEIAGEGPERESIKKIIESNGLHEYFVLLGKINNVMEFLRSVDYFVLTSHYEGFGLALLEAMDAGLPILAPNNSSIPEVLGPGHGGLFETNNIEDMLRAFHFISQDDFVRETLIEYQYDRLLTFNVYDYYWNHESLYGNIEI